MAREWVESGAVPSRGSLEGFDVRWSVADAYGIELRGTEYWVSPGQWGTENPDLGPFESFEAAAACFETVADLD